MIFFLFFVVVKFVVLAAMDLKILIRDLESIRTIDTSRLNNDRDDQVKFLSEQLNIIFTRAHLDGIKTIFNAMKSSVSVSLREFIDKIEKSLIMKLTEHDHIIIESYIQDHLTLLVGKIIRRLLIIVC
jgi:hypothetical protein